MTLPEKILAGLATDAEVARALGIGPIIKGGDWIGKGPNADDLIEWPKLTTCLTTLAEECGRRGIKTLWVNGRLRRSGGRVNPLQICAALVSTVLGEP
jgi:hypothetical protein